jgi:hypothetical protein
LQFFGRENYMASHTTERTTKGTEEAVAKDTLQDVADYVRDHDEADMGRDVMRSATGYPVASLLVLSAVVVGGSVLVAAMLRNGGPSDGPGKSRQPMRLGSAMSGLGPKGVETLSRIRDAAFSFAFDKAIDRVEGMFPGFREHYERDSRRA